LFFCRETKAILYTPILDLAYLIYISDPCQWYSPAFRGIRWITNIFKVNFVVSNVRRIEGCNNSPFRLLALSLYRERFIY